MGIYSTSINESYTDSRIDSLANLGNYELIGENFTEMGLRVVAESQANYNEFIKCIGISELAAYEETGDGDIIYEGAFSDIFAKIKEIFAKIAAKIKEIFNKFVALLDTMGKSDREFYNKYRKPVQSRWSEVKDKFEFQGYKFTHLDSINLGAALGTSGVTVANIELGTNQVAQLTADSNNHTLYDKCEAVITATKDDDFLDKTRGAVINKICGDIANTSYTVSEATKEIAAYFRDGEESKVKLDGHDIHIDEELRWLNNSKETEKKARDAYKVQDKSLKEVIKAYDDAEKKVAKYKADDYKIAGTGDGSGRDDSNKKPIDGDKAISTSTAALTAMSRAVQCVQDTCTLINTQYMNALKERSKQAKAICAKVIAANVKESYSYDDDYYTESSSYGNVSGMLNKAILR